VIPLRKLIATLTLLVLAASACSSGSDVLATIGTEPDAVEITEGNVASLYATDSVPKGDTLRGALFALIAREVLTAAAETDLGLTIDPALAERLYDDMVIDRDGQGQDTATWLGIPDAGEGMMRFNADIAVLRDSVIRELASDPAYLDELFADPIPITTVCAKHILLQTEVEAQDAILELLAGADFAALADLKSEDTAPGGDLGCRLAGIYVDDFAKAVVEGELNTFLGPVETRFGWHVILVTERTTPTREEVIADPITHLTSAESSGLWEEWFNAELVAATVTIDAEVGVWSPTGIIPPTTPTD
jgi:peptidyl-prolyl cis-trans isomerase C